MLRWYEPEIRHQLVRVCEAAQIAKFGNHRGGHSYRLFVNIQTDVCDIVVYGPSPMHEALCEVNLRNSRYLGDGEYRLRGKFERALGEIWIGLPVEQHERCRRSCNQCQKPTIRSKWPALVSSETTR